MMAKNMIFVMTHPRATSTAFERCFLSRDELHCIHEPFGDPYYFGPERMSDRFSPKELEGNQFEKTTFADVLETLNDDESGGKRIMMKDMAQYFIPPLDGAVEGLNNPPGVAKSILSSEKCKEMVRGLEEVPAELAQVNPTNLPANVLSNLDYVFLIRPPHLSVPSYYRCCIPPRVEETGWTHYRSSEAGYRELRLMYDYVTKLRKERGLPAPIVIDSTDLIGNPEVTLQKVCKALNLEWDPQMLVWGENRERDVKMFEKWKGFHDDALGSSGFRPNPELIQKGEYKTDFPTWEKSWTEKFGPEASKIISDSVKEHIDDYNYLRQFKAGV
ncbi:hypothetical protein CJU90_1783 [Yarrowia sp. C11]|nr:hypothetical protein CKK34_0510 [Yarrowia sp. E02]KAG5371722.1 hypothetical protein CJU90_1783 [Yarrowia sp. C11]